MVDTRSTHGLELPELLKKKEKNDIPKLAKKQHLKIGTWNVRRGLIIRENEITNLLVTEEIDIIFLTETDIKRQNATGYKIKGYTTHIQAGENDCDMVRIIALTKENSGVEVELREDLMSDSFPSIWFEIKDKNRSKSLIGGFYRQWSSDGKLSVPKQVEQIEEFCNQINSAASPNGKMIITGDANLCSEKWLKDDYDRKSTAQPLLQCLEINGLEVQKVGLTYQSDHLLPNGILPQSALDHVYSSETIKDLVQINKNLVSSTDHLPVITTYNLDLTKVRYKHRVTKRSFKNFNPTDWNACLAQQDWSAVENSDGVNNMVSEFTTNVTQALDQIAPMKSFTIRSNHRFGLSDSTKELMKKRDHTRNSIKGAAGNEKRVLLQQYKTLRNKVTYQIRKENIDHNNNRIEEAKNESELWKVANDVLNPRKENEWKIINKDGTVVSDELEVAETFNDFFIDKIDQLKNNIDKTIVEDPLVRLKEKMKSNTKKLEFKQITQKQLTKHMKKLNKKKSSGLDGLSQENLILGSKNLVGPLTTIINQSILEGEFPQSWKEAAVTPVLKKGSSTLLANYRPVSCLPAASKVLEIVICSQLSDYLESNKLLPRNQHGFRPRRSTMTAWQEIQLDWAMKTEQDQVTGVLLWDLSAAFDTLDCEGLCEKLLLFGVQPRSVCWVRSFLTGRSQRVKIGGKISSPKNVSTGVPQGGVLSPLIFVLFVSDLQDWLAHSTAPTYADDTSTATSSSTMDETIKNMEEDANSVLRYMASNGLVANAKKTSFLLLNCKQAGTDVSIRIGSNNVVRESSATLLGIKFEDSQQWHTQIYGKGGLLSSLNSRLYIIRRLKSHLLTKSIIKVVDGLFTSKIRYGLQLYGKVRITEEDPTRAEFSAIQLIQNNLLRMLYGSKVKDKVPIKLLLDNFNMLSVNQLNAQIKLQEMWKALNIVDYPLSIELQTLNSMGVSTRAAVKGRPIEVGLSTLTQKTCVSDAIKLWNVAPLTITGSLSLYQAKKEIRSFVRKLPV